MVLWKHGMTATSGSSSHKRPPARRPHQTRTSVPGRPLLTHFLIASTFHPQCSRCWYSGMNGKPGTFARNPRKEAGVVSDGATLSVPGIAAAGGMAVWMCPVSGFASAGFGAGSRAFGRSAGNVTDNTFDSEPAVKDSDSVESVEAHGQGAGVEIYRPASHGLPAGECGKHSPGASAAER